MQQELISLATTKPTLMIGLSAQDTNIQGLFSDARARMPWPWPSDPPAHVFAEDALGLNQRNILRFVYREAYDRDGPAIEGGALFRAYAKPALTALVLHVLCAKLRTYAQAADAPLLPPADRVGIEQGIVRLRNRLADNADTDRLAFARTLVRGISHGIQLFQLGTKTAAPSLATSGVREMAMAIGLLGLGDADADWTVVNSDPTDPTSGAVCVISPRGTMRVFFAANDRAGVQLEIDGLARPNDGDAIVIHSTSPVPTMPRSPRAPRGRRGRPGRRNIAMASLLRDAASADDLRQRFGEEGAL